MSQFLPETPQSAVQQTDFKPIVETPSLDGDIALMQRIFSAAVTNPSQIPSDFMAYLVDFIQTQRLTIPIGQVVGFRQQTDIRGRVSSAGAITNGVGFTVSKLGTGNYLISFTSPLNAVPAINATIDDNLATYGLKVANASVSSFQVLTYDMAGTLADVGFYFTASPFV